MINLRENRISHNFTGGGRTGTTGSSSPLSLFPGFAFGRSELSGREISSTCEGVLHSIIPLKFLGPNLDLVSIHLSRSPYTCTCSLHPHPIHIPYVSPELMTAPQLPSARLKKVRFDTFQACITFNSDSAPSIASSLRLLNGQLRERREIKRKVFAVEG